MIIPQPEIVRAVTIPAIPYGIGIARGKKWVSESRGSVTIPSRYPNTIERMYKKHQFELTCINYGKQEVVIVAIFH